MEACGCVDLLVHHRGNRTVAKARASAKLGTTTTAGDWRYSIKVNPDIIIFPLSGLSSNAQYPQLRAPSG